MDLESIQNKKIRNQLRYLQLELEETKIIYQGCIEKFNNDFRSYMLDDNPEPTQVKMTEDNNLKINGRGNSQKNTALLSTRIQSLVQASLKFDIS